MLYSKTIIGTVVKPVEPIHIQHAYICRSTRNTSGNKRPRHCGVLNSVQRTTIFLRR